MAIAEAPVRSTPTVPVVTPAAVERDDHDVAQGDREIGGGDGDRGPARGHDTSERAGHRQDRHRLADRDRGGVVVGAVEHPDLALVGHRGERCRKEAARRGERARIGVIAVRGEVGAEELGLRAPGKHKRDKRCGELAEHECGHAASRNVERVIAAR
jgi:hypothetical protein